MLGIGRSAVKAFAETARARKLRGLPSLLLDWKRWTIAERMAIAP
jgi:hypothetical protein